MTVTETYQNFPSTDLIYCELQDVGSVGNSKPSLFSLLEQSMVLAAIASVSYRRIVQHALCFYSVSPLPFKQCFQLCSLCTTEREHERQMNYVEHNMQVK